MKKRIILLFCIIFLVFSLTGCREKEEVAILKKEIIKLSADKTELENSISELKEIKAAEKERTGTANYIVVLNISQNHYTLDLEEHLKDSMNDLDISIPVSKDFYDSVNKGDTIDDSFRTGSFVFKSSVGTWNITVSDKYIE